MNNNSSVSRSLYAEDHDIDPFLRQTSENQFRSSNNSQSNDFLDSDVSTPRLNENGEKVVSPNQTLQRCFDGFKALRSNISHYAGFVLNNSSNMGSSYKGNMSLIDAVDEEKFPSMKLVRDIQWHPSCRKIEVIEDLPDSGDFIRNGKPRVALVYNNNTVEIHHTGEHQFQCDDENKENRLTKDIYSQTFLAKLNDTNYIENEQDNIMPSLILKHKLHEDLTGCAWRPYCLNSLAVISAKNGILYWQRIGRSDVKNIQAVRSVQTGKKEKVVPSSSASLIWSPSSYVNRQAHLDESCGLPNAEKSEVNRNSLEYQTSIRFSPNGEVLLILWYGTLFTLRIQDYSTIHNNFAVMPIAKISNCCGPINFNAGLNLGLFSACGNDGTSYVLDFNQDFTWKSLNWNEQKIVSKYKLPIKIRVQSSTWWEPSKNSMGNLLSRSCDPRPSSIEGCYLYAFENSTKIFAIQVFKGDKDISAYKNEKETFHDECKMVFDLSEAFLHADSAYLHNASEHDTMMLTKQNFIITALAWRGDICLVGHGDSPAKITILKARMNVGGTAFRFIRTIDMEDNYRIIDIEIFDDRMVAVTSESGNFEYCKIEEF